MIRPSKLTKEIQQRIGDNIALGLNYSLAASGPYPHFWFGPRRDHR